MLAAALGAPAVKLLDARVAGLDEDELRAWARAETAVLPAPHTSRSYRYPYALVTWHSEPVGVDIERVEPLEETFMESICTPSERGLLDEAAPPRGFVSSFWSSKEALAKALGDALRYDPRRLESPLLWPDGQAGPWRAAALALPPGHVGWVCWRSASAAPASAPAL
jgi:hypothetical protein